MATGAESGVGAECAAVQLQTSLRYDNDGSSTLAEAYGPAPPNQESATGEAWVGTPYIASLACRDCELCGGSARAYMAFEMGGRVVEANDCPVPVSCARSWTDLYPEEFTASDGAPVASALPCGKDGCDATFEFVQSYGRAGLAITQRDMCDIDRAGDDYHSKGQELLDSMVSSQDFRGSDAEEIEPFDGQQ